MQAKAARPRLVGQGTKGEGSLAAYLLIFIVMSSCGYGIGFLTKGVVFTRNTSDFGIHLGDTDVRVSQSADKQLPGTAMAAVKNQVKHKWAGDTIHSVLTSSGDEYQNFQTRIMYATYKMVQKMPGGERLTAFTRILHRSVPDILMDEVPTYHSFPFKPECDGWCDYPVANRPHAIQDFFDQAAKNESMIQGAWVFMLECDYVWMQPMKVPGSAWDPNVPNVQFWFDYIIPTHANAVPSMKKLYNGPASDIPASGPAPVLMRVADWQVIVKDYLRLSIQMENDEAMKKRLEWVREMYAWDAALPHHKDIKIVTEHPPNSTTIVQPPFDDGLGPAALCHYTWGALYHEGIPSKGGKQIYRWEKRDYSDIKHVLHPKPIPMPPEYKDGWILEFDSPLTRKRHDLVVLMLTQMNKAINSLPDLSAEYERFKIKLKDYEKERDIKIAKIKAEREAAAQAAKGNKSRRLMEVAMPAVV